MNFTKAIYTHLITKPKYNKKCIECDALKEDITRRDIKINEMKNTFEIEKEVWKEDLKKISDDNFKLKEDIVLLEKLHQEEIKDLKKKHKEKITKLKENKNASVKNKEKSNTKD